MLHVSTTVLLLALASGLSGLASADDEDEGPVTVKVPAWAKGEGYSLRIESEDPVRLEGDTVRLDGSNKRRRVELVGQKGRLLADDEAYVDGDVLDDLHPREWRVGVLSGSLIANGYGFRGLLQNGRFSETSFEVMWQPGPLGVSASLANISSDDSYPGNLTSSYDATQTRLAAVYELAPFARRKRGYMRRLHVLAFAGLHSTRHELKITDTSLTLQDTAKTYGPYGAVDLAFPFYAFWIEGRYYATYQEIKMDAFDFEMKSVQQGFLLGGMYAF